MSLPRLKLKIIILDAHRWKIQGRGYLKFLPKSLGGLGFQEKVQGGSSYFRFSWIFINMCFEICLKGVLYLPSPFPPHLLCASMIIINWYHVFFNWDHLGEVLSTQIIFWSFCLKFGMVIQCSFIVLYYKIDNCALFLQIKK
jgi:hypothetical protein